MIVGLPPFYTQNKAELFEKIRKSTPKFPKSISKEAKDIIMALMEKDPEKRLGSKGANDIKGHPWF